MIYYLVNFRHRQTDGQTDRQKVTHMSSPCLLHRWAQKWSWPSPRNKVMSCRGSSISVCKKLVQVLERCSSDDNCAQPKCIHVWAMEFGVRIADMGRKLLQRRLRLREAEAFEVKATATDSASASWFQNLKASTSASASWLGESFGFSFGFVTPQILNFTFGFVVSKLEKFNIFHVQIMFVCIFCLNFNKWQVIKG